MTELGRYNLSFTTGSLYYNESLIIVETFFEVNNWIKCREVILSNNLIQTRTLSSRKKILSEVISRMKFLNERELKLLINGSKQDKLNILWIAICKKYQFIKDFSVEVIREKYLNLDYFLTEADYNIFFNSKVDWHSELENIKETTAKKVKQVLFRMLREVEITGNNNEILPSIFSKDLVKEILLDNTIDFSIFPISDRTIQELQDGIRQ